MARISGIGWVNPSILTKLGIVTKARWVPEFSSMLDLTGNFTAQLGFHTTPKPGSKGTRRHSL